MEQPNENMRATAYLYIFRCNVSCTKTFLRVMKSPIQYAALLENATVKLLVVNWAYNTSKRNVEDRKVGRRHNIYIYTCILRSCVILYGRKINACALTKCVFRN